MPSRPVSSIPRTSTILRSRVILLAITISATAIFLVTIVYIVYQLWDTLFHRSRTNPFDSNSSSIPLKLQKFRYKELKSATNGFDPDHSIGKGGSTIVFRGVLRNGRGNLSEWKRKGIKTDLLLLLSNEFGRFGGRQSLVLLQAYKSINSTYLNNQSCNCESKKLMRNRNPRF